MSRPLVSQVELSKARVSGLDGCMSWSSSVGSVGSGLRVAWVEWLGWVISSSDRGFESDPIADSAMQQENRAQEAIDSEDNLLEIFL